MTTNLPHWVSYLVEAGRLAPSADNSQPWRFIFDGQSLAVEFEESRGGLGITHPSVLLAFGALIENLVQAAHHAKLDTNHWEFPDFVKTGRFLAIPTPKTDIEPIELPKVIRARHTNRAPFESVPLLEEITEEITREREGASRPLVFNDRASIQGLARAVRLASELRFQTEDIHRWLVQSLRFTATEVAREEGLDVSTLHLPPGGKTLTRLIADWRRMDFLNRFGAFKLLARIEAYQLAQTGAIVAIVGQSRNTAAWLDGGRLLGRVWLLLTAKDLAVHPYFVLPYLLYRRDTGQLPLHLHPRAERMAQEAGVFLGSQTVFMLLRVGRPKIPAIRSKRLPAKTIFRFK